MRRSRIDTTCIAKLREWFLIKQIKPTPWAESNEICRGVISRFLSGKTKISPENARKIIKGTNGYMALTDFYG